MTARPDDQLEVRFTKWGGGRHWEFAVTSLGTDRLGHWVSSPTGTVCTKPGSSFASAVPWVMLLPYDRPWVASFYEAPHHPVSVYVDITTVPVWIDGSVTMVDLDLDVIVFTAIWDGQEPFGSLGHERLRQIAG